MGQHEPLPLQQLAINMGKYLTRKRADYNLDLKRDERSRGEPLCRQYERLRVLVPLHRALQILVQQTPAGIARHRAYYEQRFQKLREFMHYKCMFSNGNIDRYFGYDTGKLVLPCPSPHMGPNNWAQIQIANLVEQTFSELPAAKQMQLTLVRNAQYAKNKFMDSLSSKQRGQLVLALEAAKENGNLNILISYGDIR